jgi:hypothetical protein
VEQTEQEETENDFNATGTESTTPGSAHHNSNSNSSHQSTAPGPASAPNHHSTTSEPTSAPHMANTSAPTRPSKGGTLAGPHRTKPANTSNPKDAAGSLLIAVLVLGGFVVGLFAIQKWNSKRNQRKTYDNVERAANGLASTASHATTHDLAFQVELATPTGRYGGSGYAPPPTERGGTWG